MKAKLLVLPVALAVLPAGCNDILTEDPRSTIVTETFFRSAADAKSAIAAAYRPLSTGSIFGTNLQWALNAGSDESRVGPEEENANIVALTQLRVATNNPYIAGTTSSGGAYAGFYQMITRANLVLERVPAIEMDATAKGYILGEAKFLRALGYHYLVRLYGDVPLVRTTEEQLTPGPRTPKAEVYAQIIADATAAEAELPATWPAGDRGRATKGAAAALLAEMYVWRSSAEGSNEWAQAAAAAERVVTSGTYALVPNYLDAFRPGSQNRTEEIFAAQSSSITGAPAIDIAAWTYPRNMNPNSNGGWGTYQPLQWFIDSYPAGDYRREVTFFVTGAGPNGQMATFLPHVHKFRPTARPGQQDVNWPVFRYADVLLLHAEALNELGRTPEAMAVVNQLRARARNGAGTEARALPADLPTTLSQAEAREAIFQERMWELAFEGDRWFDLVRRGWDYFRTSLERDPTAVDIQETDMLWPIPQPQIDLNPQLTQNPGY